MLKTLEKKRAKRRSEERNWTRPLGLNKAVKPGDHIFSLQCFCECPLQLLSSLHILIHPSFTLAYISYFSISS